MVIRTNMPALNAGRYVGKNKNQSSQNLEKLASGFRINKAADNASGLAITEKMRAQITSLDTYSYNAEDGISLIKTAEGYMDEIHSILNRLVELSTKAANGIYEETERKCIQEEVDQLHDEIDRIHDTANFNRLPLLKGGAPNKNAGKPTVIGNMPSWLLLDPASLSSRKLANTYTPPVPAGTASVTYKSASYLDFSSFDPSRINKSVGTGFYTTCCTCNNHYSIRFTDEDTSSIQKSGTHFIYNIGLKGAQTGEDVIDRIIAATNNGHPVGRSGNPHYTNLEKTNVNGKLELVVYDNRENQMPNPTRGEGLMGPGVAFDGADIKQEGPWTVPINVGANKTGKIMISLPKISTMDLNMTNLDVLTQESAGVAMGVYKEAINTVSLNRAVMGAQQNRIEHTINNINTAHENISAAKSRIKDTDMAKEVEEYTKNNILIQTAQAMLAQANTRPQDVLQLLS